MKVAGTLSIALAALVQLSTAASGQNTSPDRLRPSDALRAKPAGTAAATAPKFNTPSLEPPSDVEGTWVEDSASAQQPEAMPRYNLPMGPPAFAPPVYDEYAEKAAYLYGGHPEEYSGIDFSNDPYSGYGGDSGNGGEFTGECCGGCQQGSHCGKCGCCGSDGPCGYLWEEVHSHRRAYLREEYLYWKGKGNPLPPLVTTSTDPNIPQEFAGVLGVPETEILFGNSSVNDGWHSGGRITAGMWLVDGEFLGIEGHYFGLAQANHSFFTDSPDILARPFTEVVQTPNPDPTLPPIVTYTPSSSLLTFSGFENPDGEIVDLNGQIRVTSKTDVQSAGLVLRKLMWIEFTQNWRLDGIAGYRFFRLNDGVAIHDEWTETGGQLGTVSYASYDYFQARNEFNGGELGLIGSVYRGGWSLEGTAKIAIGNVHQNVKIDGTSFVSAGGSPFVETNNYRLLTQPTNDGRYKKDVFAVLPEVALNVRYDLTCNIRLMAGYNFMYLSQAQRSGKAINLNVNTSQIGGTLEGPAVPDFRFKNDNGYYLHGMTAGVEFRW